MQKNVLFITILLLVATYQLSAQHISEFSSSTPGDQDTDFHLPATHSFQYIIEHGDPLTEGETLPENCDFTGYVPIDSSSTYGYLSINSESTPGGVTILDIELDESIGKWIINRSEAVDFSSVGGTARNCSGTVTPWGTIISCEETIGVDNNGDGYNDLGWAIEIDPTTKQILDQDGGLEGGDKLWALGNFIHENAVVHQNRRTVYQGVDDSNGYLFKFVADISENLSSGVLFVYKGSKQGSGNWIQLSNSTATEQNTILAQSASVGATIFSGIEDVEINPIDNKVYLAVKNEDRVYRFEDSDPITGTSVMSFETFVGGMSYEIEDGENLFIEPWGTGNDNLVFDDKGNLWVTQDGDNNYIWMVENGHSQESPKVRIFARTPDGSEPTGITFTPDYRYLFMSIQHPSETNSITSQVDAFGIPRAFNKDVALVIARVENLNNNVTAISQSPQQNRQFRIYPNPVDHVISIVLEPTAVVKDLQLLDSEAKKVSVPFQRRFTNLEVPTKHLPNGIYLLRILINNNWVNEKILISR